MSPGKSSVCWPYPAESPLCLPLLVISRMCNGRGIPLYSLRTSPTIYPSTIPPEFSSACPPTQPSGHHPRLSTSCFFLLLLSQYNKPTSGLIQHPVSASALGFPRSTLTKRCGQYGPSMDPVWTQYGPSMDPADSGSFHQVLASQGAQVERHGLIP